jgi:hypothetical protein
MEQEGTESQGPSSFFDVVRSSESLKDIISNEMIEPHIYLIVLIVSTILAAIVIGYFL